ncbi:hypothetical protein G7Y89_g221 [Cudoniella acicularis]|uniref:Heterokaryon incompatibility domain-containing protein n=1 Tax=Cudoniella acicularis TaxID=354080 RepID=A0A8H4RYL9_9HELO|nr:hypothetical protein G7Y89_g221 [Cudoniella acicularis]
MLQNGEGKYTRRLEIWAEDRNFESTHQYPRLQKHNIQICDGTALCGRIIKNEINMEIIKRWLHLCKGHEKCSFNLKNAGDMRVIDVIEERVCYAANPDYAALSYTWGPPRITQLKLTKKIQDALFRTGGIREAPSTIKDAVKVCKGLGIRYLWVDALCIFQDGTSLDEINDMDKIYAGAKITIVSASGENSWAGLPGVSPDTRKINQGLTVIDGLSLSTVQPSFRKAMEGTVWSTRGWTFQESVISPRLLIFTDAQVFYQCKTDLWCEDTVLESTEQESSLELYLREWGDPLERLSLDECGSLYEYTRLVQQYTLRHFTYQSDVIRAFMGILGPLSKTLNTEFFACLPERYFDYALLFGVRAHTDPPKPPERRPGFPSWSWAGWVTAGSGIGLEEYQEHRIHSIISWFRVQEDKIQWIPNVGINDADDYTMKALPDFHLPTDLQKSEVDNLLIFETTTAFLPVSFSFREPPYTVNIFAKDFAITFPKEVEWTYLDPDWRKTQPLYLEFILIGVNEDRREELEYDDSQALHIMLIETDKRGVSSRVEQFPIRRSVWESANPVRRVVFLI